MSERFIRPPVNQRGHAIPREVSSTRVYGFIQRKPRSLETASQYHSGSSTLRRWNASSDVNAYVRMNLVKRARSIRSGVGRQMMSESVMGSPSPCLVTGRETELDGGDMVACPASSPGPPS